MTELRCPFCGALNSVAADPSENAARKSPKFGLLLGSLLGGLLLLVVGSLSLEYWLNSDNADHVFSLTEQSTVVGTSELGATRAARMPDGSLWLACQTSRLCGVSEAGQWLGSIELPWPKRLDFQDQRYGPTRGMAADRSGRLYMSYGTELIEVSISERRMIDHVDALPAGEHPSCLAMAPDDSLVMMTSEDDLVILDAARKVRARWRHPLLQHDARHHGCDTLTYDAAGQVWILPEGAPAIYVFTPSGALVRRYVPGGSGHYMSLAVLSDGSAVTGYNYDLLFLGPDFLPRTGPITSKRAGWGEISEVIRTPSDDLIVTTFLGTVARWDRASTRW